MIIQVKRERFPYLILNMDRVEAIFPKEDGSGYQILFDKGERSISEDEFVLIWNEIKNSSQVKM